MSFGDKKGRVSRRDVAKAAGVSLTTVTHALNPPPNVRMKPGTRELIQKIAAEMGYIPNFVGKALVEGRTYNIGLLQPAYESISYSFYHLMVRGMARAMEADGYNLLIMFRSHDDKYLKIIEQGRIDGLFILQSDQQSAEIEKVEKTGLPTVVVNKNYISDKPRMGCVQSANEKLASELTDKFLRLGCKNVLEINNHLGSDSNAQIHKAFVEEAGRYTSSGASFSTMIPDMRNFRVQLREAFLKNPRWDGVYIDGPDLGTIFAEEAEKTGMKAGSDFHLFVSHVFPFLENPPAYDMTFFGQQPELVGEKAWEVLKDLMGPGDRDKNEYVPYIKIEKENVG